MTQRCNDEWLRGIFGVLPTPFDASFGLDLDGLSRVTDRLAASGMEGVMVLGSGGENVYLTEGEREAVVRCVLGRLPAHVGNIVGIITFGTQQAVLEAKRHRDMGARALLVAAPQYHRTSIDTLLAHYEAITRAVDIPVLYYHYPSTTHLHLDAAEVGALFERVPLAGIKESSLSTPELVAHRARIGRDVRIFSGQSFSLRRALQEGAVGAICPLSVVLPRTANELVRAHREGDDRACSAAQQRILEAMPLISGVTAPVGVASRVLRWSIELGLPLPEGASLPHAGVKEALHAMNLIDHAGVRPPQRPLRDAQRQAVRRLVERRAEL